VSSCPSTQLAQPPLASESFLAWTAWKVCLDRSSPRCRSLNSKPGSCDQHLTRFLSTLGQPALVRSRSDRIQADGPTLPFVLFWFLKPRSKVSLPTGCACWLASLPCYSLNEQAICHLSARFLGLDLRFHFGLAFRKIFTFKDKSLKVFLVPCSLITDCPSHSIEHYLIRIRSWISMRTSFYQYYFVITSIVHKRQGCCFNLFCIDRSLLEKFDRENYWKTVLFRFSIFLLFAYCPIRLPFTSWMHPNLSALLH